MPWKLDHSLCQICLQHMLHQKKKNPPQQQNQNQKKFLAFIFFPDNFSFCVCHLNGKCQCRMHIDQQSGGCLYSIQETKGWRNECSSNLRAVTQGYWRAVRVLVSCTNQGKCKIAFRCYRTEKQQHFFGQWLGAGLAWTHLTRRAGTCTSLQFYQGIQSPPRNVPSTSGKKHRACAIALSMPAHLNGQPSTHRDGSGVTHKQHSWSRVPSSWAQSAWLLRGPVCLSLVLSWGRINPTGSGAGMLTMRPWSWASRCCIGLPWPQHFLSELQEISQLKYAETGSCLHVFHVWSAELLPSTPALRAAQMILLLQCMTFM